MGFEKRYMRRAKEIIGDRTLAEAAYDIDVLHGLEHGQNIRR